MSALLVWADAVETLSAKELWNLNLKQKNPAS